MFFRLKSKVNMQNFYNQAKSNVLGVAEYLTPVLKVRNIYNIIYKYIYNLIKINCIV